MGFAGSDDSNPSCRRSRRERRFREWKGSGRQCKFINGPATIYWSAKLLRLRPIPAFFNLAVPPFRAGSPVSISELAPGWRFGRSEPASSSGAGLSISSMTRSGSSCAARRCEPTGPGASEVRARRFVPGGCHGEIQQLLWMKLGSWASIARNQFADSRKDVNLPLQKNLIPVLSRKINALRRTKVYRPQRCG